MIKNKASALWSTIKGLTVFDKLNLLVVVIFFISAIILPIAHISPINNTWEMTISLFSLDNWKTTLLVLCMLAINAGMSINSKFKSWFLEYTGVWNDIYARFFQKWVIFCLLMFFGEIIIHLRSSLTQTINLSWWYYFLWWLLIVWLCIDFLFLQKNYKTSSTYNHAKNHLHSSKNNEEETNQQHNQTFKNLFDQ